MKEKMFLVAGRRKLTDKVFLQSKNVFNGGTIFHRNDFSTLIRLPWPFYRKHFIFERSTGIYRTELTYGEIQQFITVVPH